MRSDRAWVDRARLGARRAADATLDRVRHARHPVTGWRKWSLIGLEAVAGFVVMFALVNLALGAWINRDEPMMDRFFHEAGALWLSPAEGEPVDPSAFRALHGEALGRAPSGGAIRNWFSEALSDDGATLDHIMVAEMDRRLGGLSAETFPPGVYVGARAIGPDAAPWVGVTKWLWHFLFFPRHAYVLVVPETGPALVFSASQGSKFDDEASRPDRLEARIERYAPGAYDYPSSGQAVHELIRIAEAPEDIDTIAARLRAAQARLAAADTRYGVLAPNSNTVIGCLLEEAGVLTPAQRADAILTLRAPGVGAACR